MIWSLLEFFYLQENTFQAILITDGEYSYTVFTYMCGLMEWDNGATIGFVAAGGQYANNDPSSSDVACENSPDSKWNNVIYRLSDANPEYPPPGMLSGPTHECDEYLFVSLQMM